VAHPFKKGAYELLQSSALLKARKSSAHPRNGDPSRSAEGDRFSFLPPIAFLYQSNKIISWFELSDSEMISGTSMREFVSNRLNLSLLEQEEEVSKFLEQHDGYDFSPFEPTLLGFNTVARC